MRNSRKPILLFVFHSSVGEINWITPYIDYLFKHKKEYELVSLFIDPNTHKKAIKEKHNYNIISDCTTIIPRPSLVKFLLENRKNVKLIFKDFWPLKSNSLVANILHICKESKLVLFPHAYALYDIKKTPEVFDKEKATHDSDVYDILLLNSEYDIPYWSKKIPLDKIRVVGALGYSEQWMEHIAKTYEDYINENGKKSSFNILFSIRGAAKGYLLEEDYQELIDSSLEVLLSLEDAHIFIRPHPRQSLEALEEKLSKYSQSKYTIVNDNPFVSSFYCDLAVNFWTSVISDNIAAGIPTVEYYKYNVENDQWFPDNEGKVISFYTHFGMTHAVQTPEKLSEILNRRHNFIQEAYPLQKKAFSLVFTELNKAGDHFLNVVDETLTKNTDRQNRGAIDLLKAWLFLFVRQTKYFYAK